MAVCDLVTGFATSHRETRWTARFAPISLADADGGTDVLAVHDGLLPGVLIADNEVGWTEALAKLAALVEID